eukprot:703444-Prorocentrum_minimum.AAC.1
MSTPVVAMSAPVVAMSTPIVAKVAASVALSAVRLGSLAIRKLRSLIAEKTVFDCFWLSRTADGHVHGAVQRARVPDGG